MQRAGDIRAQRVEVGLASGRGVVSRTRRRRILICALPVDRRLGDTDKMQSRRRGFQTADGNREHDTVSDPREVAVTDERGAIAEKDAIEKRVRGRRRRRDECQREQRHGAQSNPAPASHDL